jgi:hypothetical protein
LDQLLLLGLVDTVGACRCGEALGEADEASRTISMVAAWTAFTVRPQSAGPAGATWPICVAAVADGAPTSITATAATAPQTPLLISPLEDCRLRDSFPERIGIARQSVRQDADLIASRLPHQLAKSGSIAEGVGFEPTMDLNGP